METMRQMEVSSTAPVRLRHDIKESAIRTPRMPPAENAPPHGRHSGPIDSAVQALRNNSTDPKILTQGAWIVCERTHFQASIQSSAGIPKAPSPSNWKQRSEAYDPANPVKLWACSTPEAVFQDGSCG